MFPITSIAHTLPSEIANRLGSAPILSALAAIGLVGGVFLCATHSAPASICLKALGWIPVPSTSTFLFCLKLAAIPIGVIAIRTCYFAMVDHSRQPSPVNNEDEEYPLIKSKEAISDLNEEIKRRLKELPSLRAHSSNDYLVYLEQILEMATANATDLQGDAILDALEKLQGQIENLLWESEIRNVKDAISEIRACLLMLENYPTLDSGQRKSIGKDLYKASFRLAEQFMNVRGNEAPFYDRSLLVAYSKRLPRELLPEQQKIETTRWFRQIIQYQVTAFNCYLKMNYLENSDSSMAMNERKEFESMIEQQLISNKEFIVSEFIYKSDASAVLELEQIQMRADLLALIKENS